jgi:hypothetical protein
MEGTKTILKILAVIIAIGFIGVLIGEGIRIYRTKMMKDKSD